MALTSVAMKCLEKLVLRHINSIIPASVDPYQFSYCPNRSTDHAVALTPHYVLQQLEDPNTYARLLFLDYSSAFNTIRPMTVIEKLAGLGIPTPTRNWILDFLTDRPQVVRIGHKLSAELTVSTRTLRTIKGTLVERNDSRKFLGRHIPENLSWATNTTLTARNAQQRLHFVRVLRTWTTAAHPCQQRTY